MKKLIPILLAVFALASCEKDPDMGKRNISKEKALNKFWLLTRKTWKPEAIQPLIPKKMLILVSK